MNRREALAILQKAQELGIVTGRISETHPDLTLEQVWAICHEYVLGLGHPRAKLIPRYASYIEKNFVRASHSRRR
jgi:hypothetical protein